MGVIIPNGYGQASFKFQNTSNPKLFVVTFGFKDNTGSGLANTAAGLWHSYFTATGRPFNVAKMSNEYAMVECAVTIMTLTGPIVGSYAPANVGTVVTNSLPRNCAMLVRKNTSRGGRHGRGRMYVPPFNFDEANVSSAGAIAAGTLAPIQTLYADALTAAQAGQYPPYLLHESPSVTPDAVTSIVCQGTLATQRTRMRK